MVSDELGAIEDAHPLLSDIDLDARPHQQVRNAVANGVDVDECIVGNDATQPPLTHTNRLRWKRLQRGALLLEALVGDLVGRAVHTPVDSRHPRRQMGLQLGERRELATRKSVALHELHAVLDLALRPRAVRRASTHAASEVLAERDQPLMQDEGVRLDVTTRHKAPRVVDEQHPSDATEVAKRRRDAVPPVLGALDEEGLHEDAPRVAEHGRHQVNDDDNAADANLLLAEIDLHLFARPSLVARGGDVSGALLSAHRRHHALYGSLADIVTLLREEVLHDDGVALGDVDEKLPRQCNPGDIEASRLRAHLLGRSGAAQVALHRLAADADFAGDAPRAPSEACQRPNLHHNLWLDHRDLHGPDLVLLLHPDLLRLAGVGPF